uniref:L,D-transpeptidase family protein n=1 Tax=Thaumasiovibrio occultus TaxID=1891184 RepID=UPI000B34B4A5|nr:L,D-transpeptidase family protein [Thaumasiovibrio occultus]
MRTLARNAVLTGCLVVAAQGWTATISMDEEIPTTVSSPTQRITIDEFGRRWLEQANYDNVVYHYPKQLAHLYSLRDFSPIWQEADARQSLENQLRVIALADLSPWFSERLALLEQAKSSAEWRHYDVLATDTLIAYMRYQELARTQGRTWYFGAGADVDGLSPAIAEMDGLTQALSSHYFYSWLEGRKPLGSVYDEMQQSLDALIAIKQTHGHLPPFTVPNVLRPNDYLPQGEELVEILVTLGDLDPQVGEQIKASGVNRYSTELVQAVKRFQTRHGLGVDGVIGPATRGWLNISLDERVRLMALNMERLRVWNPQRSNMLVVNLPNFELKLWQDDEMVFDSRVIVGRPSRRTPLLTSQLDTVVFNPPWNVPPTIMEEDILPRVKADMNYLSRHNYQILKGWSSNEVIAPESIDWSAVNVSRFPYRIQQAPGNSNALGRFKFNMPNSQAIYLHDTPSKGLFNRSHRALSSGCIRVERAASLASLLMSQSGVSSRRVSTYRSSLDTKFVRIRGQVPVELVYQTAWVEDGQRQYRNDIYSYDQPHAGPFDRERLTALGY